MLLRLPYLALTSMVTLLRLLRMSGTDKDIETPALRHQLAVPQRHVDNHVSHRQTRRSPPPSYTNYHDPHCDGST